MAKTKAPQDEARPQPGVDHPGVSMAVGRCSGCAAPVRNAILQGVNLTSTGIRVNAQPAEMVLPDGRVLPLFTPHDSVCKNPKAIHMADGRRKIIG